MRRNGAFRFLRVLDYGTHTQVVIRRRHGREEREAATPPGCHT
jgi:hypothetical protein